MTTKPRIYNKSAICRACGGDGRKWKPTEGMPQHKSGQWETCDLCKGTGMVNVRIATTVTITPKFPITVSHEVE